MDDLTKNLNNQHSKAINVLSDKLNKKNKDSLDKQQKQLTLNCKKDNENLKTKLLEDYQEKTKELEQAHIKQCNN